jgi:hypothetical protein
VAASTIDGPPDSVELHPGFSPPIEIWRYAFLEGCPDAGLTFTDKTGGGDYILSDADVDWLRQMRATGKETTTGSRLGG